MPCLWDSDVTSEYLKGKHPQVVPRALAYLSQYRQIHVSVITCYEILRGLKAKNATNMLAIFEALCQRGTVLPVLEPITVLASDIWVHLRKTGQLIGDNDI